MRNPRLLQRAAPHFCARIRACVYVVYSGEIRKPEKFFFEESSDEEEDLENVLQAERERVEVEERDRLQRQR